MPVILTREEYNGVCREILFQIGTVNELGVNWFIYDLKDLDYIYNKLKGISAVKRLKFKKKILN